MTAEVWIAILGSAIISATPILFACIGEIFSERAGILNLGLEGIMLMGAVMAFITASSTSNLGLAILVTILTGALLGLLYAFVTVTLRANQIVAGLAMVFFGTGLSGFLGKAVSGTAASVTFQHIAIPGLSQIPVVGQILFNQDLMVYAAYVIVPIAAFYIFKTRPGLKLRALGENPGALDAVGINVNLLRYSYVMVGCILAAVGGAYLTLAYTPAWTDGMTAGKGWIALALVIFASWNPWKGLAGALLFGGIDVLGFRLQAIGVTIPSFILSMLPYICTVIVLILTTQSFLKKRNSAPAALGVSYFREDR
jgi:general nucleoside transport system permease protein